MSGINELYEETVVARLEKLLRCLEGIPVGYVPKDILEISYKLADYATFFTVSNQYLKDPTGSGLVCLLNNLKLRYPSLDSTQAREIWVKLESASPESLVIQRICSINAFDELFDKLKTKLYL